IFGVLLFIAMSGSRLSFRLLDTAVSAARSVGLDGRIPVLIYGAGKGGKLVCDEIASNPQMTQYGTIGFVDDDPNRIGRRLCGFRIQGAEAWAIEKIVGDLEIWISSPKIPTEKALVFSERLKRWTRIRRIRLELVTVHERFEYRIAATQDDTRHFSVEPPASGAGAGSL